MAEPHPLILSAARTPIGRYLGALASKSAVELGIVAAREAIARSGVSASSLEEAIVGCVLSAGLGQAPARQVALGAGMLSASSALTVNMVCGSGLRAVMLAETAIRSGSAECVLAGGMESMSHAPHLLKGGRAGWKLGDGVLVDSILLDGLTCATEGWAMGMAAERTAEVCRLTQADLDEYAAISQQRAAKAIASGWFRDEIAPVSLPSKKGLIVVDTDEGPRPETTPQSLSRLSSAFKPDGVVTAGNSSTLSDGGAMVVVGSQALATRLNLRPIARILASATSGLDPRDLFLAPIMAVKNALEKANLTVADIDVFEINEAFASQMIGCIRGLELPLDRVNVHGGAIALGHPIGASGARILVTLLYAMKRRGGRYGVAALCLGGGNAVAIVVEALKEGSL